MPGFPEQIALCPYGCDHVLYQPNDTQPYCMHHGFVDKPGVVYVKHDGHLAEMTSSPRIIAASKTFEPDAPGPDIRGRAG